MLAGFKLCKRLELYLNVDTDANISQYLLEMYLGLLQTSKIEKSAIIVDG